jgi:hypothetical protein
LNGASRIAAITFVDRRQTFDGLAGGRTAAGCLLAAYQRQEISRKQMPKSCFFRRLPKTWSADHSLHDRTHVLPRPQ